MFSGCALHNRNQAPVESQISRQERKALQLFEQGSYRDSAQLFMNLASVQSARQNVLRLQAAQALLKDSQDNRARDYLALIEPEKLSAQQRNQFFMTHAQLDLNFGSFEQALEWLNLVDLLFLNQQQKSVYFELRAFSYALNGQLLKSVHERIVLDSFLQAERRTANNIAIMELLDLVPEQGLKKPHNDFVYAGWVALKLASRKSGAQRKQAFDEWQINYLGHPGQLLLDSGYFRVSGFKLTEVHDIAVLLPESGIYSSHAKAVKAGFVAAYQRQEGLRPNVRFYDTEQAGVVSVYRQAVVDGAQLVIGPLNKKYIKELSQSGDLAVPVMALNHVEGLVKTNLYQFALSPIDEVQQVVRQARHLNLQNAIILAPDTVNGRRVSNYFQESWEGLDANVLDVRGFDAGTKDFSLPVRHMLNINESEYRSQLLQKVIGFFENEPRRRQDVDVIFLVANRPKARLINPQFYHNRAGSVIVYGLSQVYSGLADKNRDMDLEGINFCTIPWLIDNTYLDNLSRGALFELTEQFPEKYQSLIAFGIDAYAIVPYLNELGTMPYYGATGDLLLNEYNRIERHLTCGKFNNGEVVVVDQDVFDYQNSQDIQSH